jgi:hypothetical protein
MTWVWPCLSITEQAEHRAAWRIPHAVQKKPASARQGQSPHVAETKIASTIGAALLAAVTRGGEEARDRSGARRPSSACLLVRVDRGSRTLRLPLLLLTPERKRGLPDVWRPAARGLARRMLGLGWPRRDVGRPAVVGVGMGTRCSGERGCAAGAGEDRGGATGAGATRRCAVGMVLWRWTIRKKGK